MEHKVFNQCLTWDACIAGGIFPYSAGPEAQLSVRLLCMGGAVPQGDLLSEKESVLGVFAPLLHLCLLMVLLSVTPPPADHELCETFCPDISLPRNRA